jgi:ABC-type multidrug transport system fused ATPase/permease subunit
MLFKQSIEDNIQYAKLDATDKGVTDACKAVRIHDHIASLPLWYRLSGGEGVAHRNGFYCIHERQADGAIYPPCPIS